MASHRRRPASKRVGKNLFHIDTGFPKTCCRARGLRIEQAPPAERTRPKRCKGHAIAAPANLINSFGGVSSACSAVPGNRSNASCTPIPRRSRSPRRCARGRNGGRPKGLPSRAEPTACAAETLYREGKLSTREIAARLQISKSTLYSYLRHRGVPIGVYREHDERRSNRRSKRA